MKAFGLHQILFWIIPAIISVVITANCAKKPVANIGDTAEDFTLLDMSGKRIKLSHFKGQNILLFFWTVGCEFCQTDNIVYLNDIFLRGRKTDFLVLSINIAGQEGEVVEFIKQKGLIIPVLMDRDGVVAMKKYGIYMVPTMFIIDGNGVIREKAIGFFDKTALWDFVAPYLSFLDSDSLTKKVKDF
jgi:peroxiredoxin